MKILKVKGTNNIFDVFYGESGWADHMRVRVVKSGPKLDSYFLFGTNKNKFEALKAQIEEKIRASA